MKKRFVLFLVFLMVIAGVWGLAYGKQEAAQRAAAPAQSATKTPRQHRPRKALKKRRQRLQARLSASRQTGCCGR